MAGLRIRPIRTITTLRRAHHDQLTELLRSEAEHAEEHKDAQATASTKVSRPGGRAKVYSIRLSDDEVASLESAAIQAGVPASELARSWITEHLAEDGGATDLHAIAETLQTFSKRLAAL
ncbi:MAG: hypothetical protein EPN48_04380 [Microbacteriaceae bacterium]|nr:MAG: hypothetical protein EPN48_04380 [Microbacteriaceae bacterium]